MSTLLLITIAVLAGLTTGILIASGQAEWLVDVSIAVAVLPLLEPWAVVLLLGVQYVARRSTFSAVSLAHVLNIHPLVGVWLLPGAYEKLDSRAAGSPGYSGRIMSNAKSRAREVFQMELLEKAIRRDQEIARQYAGTPKFHDPAGTPLAEVVTKVDSDDAETIARQLAAGKTASQVAKSLPGYHPRKHSEYVARVEAVRAVVTQ